MTWRLTATLTHKSFPAPVFKIMHYEGDSIDDVLAKIETLPQHKKNLKHHRKAAFRDVRGVKHSWVLEQVTELN